MTGQCEPLPREIPAGLDAIIRRCLEKDLTRRYESAREVADDLKTLSTTFPDEKQKHRSRWARRILLSAPLTIAVLLGLMFAIPSTRNLMLRRHAVTVPAPVPVRPETSLPKTPTVTSRNERTRKPDVRVWVNTHSGVYHCPGSRWYGKTKEGEYMTETRAQKKGYTVASGKACNQADCRRASPRATRGNCRLSQILHQTVLPRPQGNAAGHRAPLMRRCPSLASLLPGSSPSAAL